MRADELEREAVRPAGDDIAGDVAVPEELMDCGPRVDRHLQDAIDDPLPRYCSSGRVLGLWQLPVGEEAKDQLPVLGGV